MRTLPIKTIVQFIRTFFPYVFHDFLLDFEYFFRECQVAKKPPLQSSLFYFPSFKVIFVTSFHERATSHLLLDLFERHLFRRLLVCLRVASGLLAQPYRWSFHEGKRLEGKGKGIAQNYFYPEKGIFLIVEFVNFVFSFRSSSSPVPQWALVGNWQSNCQKRESKHLYYGTPKRKTMKRQRGCVKS